MFSSAIKFSFQNKAAPISFKSAAIEVLEENRLEREEAMFYEEKQRIVYVSCGPH